MKKPVSWLTVLMVLTVTVLIIGTLSLEAATTKQVKLTWWNLYTPTRSDVYKELIRRFEEENPNIEIDYQETPSESYRDDLFVAISSGEYPDIMWDWALENTFQYSRNGIFLELTPYFDEDNGAWRNTIMPAAMDAFTDPDGKVWGLPYFFQAKLFYYNTDIFKDLSLEEPQDWEEFISVCDKIKESGTTPIALGNLEGWNAMHFVDILFQKIVGEETFEADQYLLSDNPYTDEGYVKAIETMKFLIDNYTNTYPNGVDYASSKVLFYTERAAMIYDGAWNLGYYGGAGDEVPEEFRDKWDYYLFPNIPDTKGNPNYIHGVADAGWVVSSKCEYPDEAVKFLKFITSLENAKYVVKNCGEINPVIGAVNEETAEPAILKLGEFINKAEGSIPWQDIVIEASFAELMRNETQAVWAEEKTAEEAMEVFIEKAAELKLSQK